MWTGPAGGMKRMDESIAILRGLAARRRASSSTARSSTCRRSRSPRCPPNPSRFSSAATPTPRLGRAARLGDGWLHGGGDPADLPGLLERLARFRAEEGTEARPFEVHVISADAYTLDGVRRLEDQGVTDLIVGFRWPYATGPDTEPLDDKLTHLRRYADTILTNL